MFHCESYARSTSVIALAAFLSSAHTLAQEQDLEQEVTIAPGVISLAPISIFATLNPISSFDYPGQVSVIEREEILTKQSSAIGDVFRDTPGVLVDGGARRAGQQPTIRGFREEDILIVVDGVRQNYISAHDGRLFIEPDLLKSVEVVKGPVSSLYGSGALGGVIALTTVDATDFLAPGETAGLRVKGGFQSTNKEYLLTTTGFVRSENQAFDLITSFTYRDGDNIELGDGARTSDGVSLTSLPDQHEIHSGLIKGTAKITPDIKLTGTWITYNYDGENPNNPQGAEVSDTNNRGVSRKVENDQISGKLSWDPTGNSFVDGNLQVYWNKSINEEDETANPATFRNRVLSREMQTFGGKIDNRSHFALSDASTLTLTYGAEYYIDNQSGEDTLILGSDTNPDALNPVADAKANFGGVFIQSEFKFQQPLNLPGELTVIPSLRFDTFDLDYKDNGTLTDFSDDALSPKIGMSYKPAPWLLLFGNYGEAFRAPSFNELFAQGNHFPGGQTFGFGPPQLAYNIFISNPNLRPQEGETVEVGAGLDFKNVATSGDRLTIKGSYFHTDAENFIDSVVVQNGCSFAPFPGFDQSTCFSAFVNRDAELDGVEIKLEYDSDRFFGGFSYETIDGTDKNPGERVLGTDTFTGEFLGSLYPDRYILHAGVKLPEVWTTLGSRLTIADDFNEVNDPDDRIDGYTTLDLYATVKPTEGAWEGLRVDLGVDNLTDEAYSRGFANNIQPGRNYKAGVAWTVRW